VPKTNLWQSYESLVTRHWTLCHHMFVRDKTPLVYSNLVSRLINITRSLHVKRPTLSIITWLPGRAIKSPPHPPELLKQNLALTWSHVLHVIKFTLLTTQANHFIISLEFAHFSQISNSLHNKTSLNIIFTQFCILLSHQNKIYSLNTTIDFYVASAKLRPLQCGANIFAGV